MSRLIMIIYLIFTVATDVAKGYFADFCVTLIF